MRVSINYNSSPPFYLQSLTDYDGKTTTFSYDANGMLTNVAMPYGRSASMTYSGGLMTGITDAEGMSSSFSYQAFDFNDFGTVETHTYLSSMTTPYGTTTFSHYEAPPETTTIGPPSIHNGAVTYPNPTAVYLGWGGGTNRVNKACTVGLPDGSHELYMYRFDSRGLVPQTYPGQTPNEDNFPFIDDGSDPGGEDEPNSIDHLLSTRNSFHWNRQQYLLLSTTDIQHLTPTDFTFATTKHWLQNGTRQSIYPFAPEENVSDQLSFIREAAPDGVHPAPMTWYLHNNQFEFQAGDYSGATTISLLPNGDTRFSSTSYYDGLLQGATEGAIVGGRTSYSRGVLYDYTDFPEWLSAISPPNDNGITFTYLNGGQEIEEFFTYGTNTFYYNSRHQLTGAVYSSGDVITNIYGTDGFLAQSINLGAHATNTFVFANGLPATVTTPLGLTLSFSWDNLERLTQITFPDGTTISNNYSLLDIVGRKDRLNHWTYASFDAMDQLESSTDANGGISYYSYCFCGGLSSLTDPLGNSTTFGRDNDGNVTEASSSDGFNTFYTVDQVQQVTGATTSAGRSLTYDYNDLGLVTNVLSSAGSLVALGYDLGNRPVAVTDARGILTQNVFEPLGRVNVFVNGLGRSLVNNYSGPGLYQTEDFLNHSTFYGYDTAGRLDAITNTIGGTEYFGYNAASELATLTDGNGHTNSWTYDIYGRALRKTDGNGVLVETNGYNVNGWLTAHWTPAMGLTTYTYDNNGNRLTTAYSSGVTITATYDALNRLATMSDAIGTSTFTYTNFGAFRGALASQSGPFTADTLTAVYTNRVPQSQTLAQPSGSWTETFSYDTSGRLQSETSPAGTFGYTYNGASGQILDVSLPGGLGIGKTYDGAGQLLSTTFAGALDSYTYTYDWDGRRTLVTRANSATVNYSYDNLGQLLTAAGTEPNGYTPRANENLTYTYDPAGNLTSRQNDTLLQGFQTDKANQLLSVTRSNSLLTVAGSLSNSPTSLTINGQSAAVYSDLTFAVPGLTISNANGLNQWTAVVNGTLTNSITTVLPTAVSLRYDANGNLLWDGVNAFTYDCANQLASVTVTNLIKTTYAYDGFGRRRIRKDYSWSGSAWTETNEVHYVYNGMNVLQERNSSNVPLVTYTRGINGLLARTDTNGSAFYNADGNGNITALVNSSGTLVAKYLYDSYGNTVGIWGTLAAANTYRFSSKEIDTRSGLYYYGYRYYEPNLQRWLNRDPIKELGGINLYGFVGNNPISLVDPLGLQVSPSMLANYPPDFSVWVNAPTPPSVPAAPPGTPTLGPADPNAQPYIPDYSPISYQAFNDLTGSTLTPQEAMDVAAPISMFLPTPKMVPNCISRFFYDSRRFRTISKEYWDANGPANGRSLHHWLFPQSADWVPQGIRNAGFNLMELPPIIDTPFGGLNQWMGMSGSPFASYVDWGIRLGVPTSIGGAAYGGSQFGNYIFANSNSDY